MESRIFANFSGLDLQTGRKRTPDINRLRTALQTALTIAPITNAVRTRRTGLGLLMGDGMLTKQAIYHGFMSFLGIAVYLFLLLFILALHEAVVSAKNGIEYHFYGFAIINALVLGKVILVADDLHFAEWFIERAPIYSILVKSAAFTYFITGLRYHRRGGCWDV